MKKGWKITLCILSAIVLAFNIFLCVWFWGDEYPDFKEKCQSEFEIPGLHDGWTPQGITYNDNTKEFLTSGYMKNSSEPSRIYVSDAETNQTVKYFTLKYQDKFFTGHAGGIATDGTNVWICGKKEIFKFDYNQINQVENGKSINITSQTKLDHESDYAFVENNNLWVGEFENGGKYQLPQSHFIKTPSGKQNKALSFCYQIDSNTTDGANFNEPIKILSTPSLVQGMAIKDNKVIISTSYSLPNSHIYIYDNVFTKEAKTITYNNKEIPLYILDDEDMSYDLETPSMSEEIVIANDKVYILFENACKKYFLFTREQLTNVYSFDLNITK